MQVAGLTFWLQMMQPEILQGLGLHCPVVPEKSRLKVYNSRGHPQAVPLLVKMELVGQTQAPFLT